LSLTCLPCLPVPLERQIGPAQAGAEIGQKGAFFKGLTFSNAEGLASNTQIMVSNGGSELAIHQGFPGRSPP